MAFYITTPIYYVNAAPHLGHAYTAIAADVLARHHRQRGEDVFFLTGTDEHGEPVALAAEREGVSPQELADRNAERFRALMPQLDVSNDFFIRTTDEGHKVRVQEVLQRVHDNGHVYNETSNPPRVAGKCDLDGSPLIQREDDKAETIRNRMAVTLSSLRDVIAHYKAAGVLKVVDGVQPIDRVTADLLAALPDGDPATA